MKTIIIILFSCLIAFNVFADVTSRDADTLLANQDAVKVNYNCQYINFDVPPLIVEGRTFVELNAIFNAMDISLQWDGSTQKVTGTKGNTVIEQVF